MFSLLVSMKNDRSDDTHLKKKGGGGAGWWAQRV